MAALLKFPLPSPLNSSPNANTAPTSADLPPCVPPKSSKREADLLAGHADLLATSPPSASPKSTTNFHTSDFIAQRKRSSDSPSPIPKSRRAPPLTPFWGSSSFTRARSTWPLWCTMGRYPPPRPAQPHHLPPDSRPALLPLKTHPRSTHGPNPPRLASTPPPARPSSPCTPRSRLAVVGGEDAADDEDEATKDSRMEAQTQQTQIELRTPFLPS
ncbi:hypothetical protein C8R44DRAFT_979198 [Mycena epipterygia]|nr:hypothetical protein C8R44DRAFT_979198 [Mycena epipterygia]